MHTCTSVSTMHQTVALSLLPATTFDRMVLLADWWDVYVGIGSITSTTNGTLLGFGKGWPGVDRLNEPSLVPLVGARWYALNLLSELDQVRLPIKPKHP